MPWPKNHSSKLSADEVSELNEKFTALDQQLGFELTDDFEPF